MNFLRRSNVSSNEHTGTTSTTKRPNARPYSSVHTLCKEKRWCTLAVRLVPPPQSKDEKCERGLVADLLTQLDSIGGLPTHVMVAVASLSRRRRPVHDASFAYWPMNCMPATRQSLQRCRSEACKVHLSVIFQYMTESGLCTLGARQEIIRLLTAVLYLISDEETLEHMLERVFDITCLTMKSEDEEEAEEEEEKKVTSNDGERRATETVNGDAAIHREKSIVIQRGEFVASKIGQAANWVSYSLHGRVVPTVNNGLDNVGSLVKDSLQPAPEPIIDRRTGVVTKTYTGAVRRSTGGIKSTAQVVSSGVREGATTVAKIVKDCIDEETKPEHEDEEQRERRELLEAAGTIGMATFGAVALVGESLLDSSSAVVKKGVLVTADIVRHRHGADAGQIVEDVFESTGNVLSITRTSFQATHISKAATQNIAKMHIGGS